MLGVKIRKVIDALERFAPLPLQESYDNAGLQVGLTEAEISGALLCLDVTEAVIDEAIRKGCNLVVAHHPLIFRKLAHVSDGNYVERAVMKAIKNDVVIVAAHTNMDNAEGGVNFKMAEKLGLEKLEPLQGPVVDGKWSGVVGTLPAPMAANVFLQMVKHEFGVASLRANDLLQRPVQRVALCGGAGSFMLGDALRAGADAFITGEMGYHEFFGYEQKIQICVIGHYESEQFTTEIFRDIIQRDCPGVKTFIAETNTNPIVYL
ncbi:MAG: Nif3-like dinuclear metal center hexameric protein [Prevotella sp.]|nr:Nif3-like dinuclear metal center hexameric protein [Prevotella sp.]